MKLVHSNLLVDDVMRRWPTTIRLFVEQKMYCIGCPITGFHTIEEACRAHGIELRGFLASLEAVAAASLTDDEPAC